MKLFAITGIPRSGTSILSAMISTEAKNAYCINEVFYDTSTLLRDLVSTAGWLIAGMPVPNKYFGDAQNPRLVTNLHEGERVEWKAVDKEFDADIALGSKILTPYLDAINIILAQKIETIAVVRDPVYTIGSWRSKRVKNMEVAQVGPDNMSIRWGGVPFTSNDPIERQAEIWEEHARKIKMLHEAGRISLLKYEEMLVNSGPPVGVSDFFAKLLEQLPKLGTRNKDHMYKDSNIKAIREAVAKYCPSREYFGYA